MYKKGGKTEKRIRKLVARFYKPDWVEIFGVQLPLTHPVITPPIYRDIYYGDYERKEVEIIRSRLKPEDRVMEVGAGLGFLSAFCSRIVGDAQIHSYEANPALIDVIGAVHTRNGVRPTVTNAVLGQGAGTRDFYVNKDFWASSLVAPAAGAQATPIPQIDLTEEIRRVAPTFLIVDIEGGEYEFFRISDFPGVKKVCVEMHPDVLGNAGVSEILADLFAKGFVIDFACMQKNVLFLYRP